MPSTLSEAAACRKGLVAVEDADVVHTEKPAAEHTAVVDILLVEPPHDAQGQRAVRLGEEGMVADTGLHPIQLIDLPCRPRVQGRVGVAEGPFVGRDLSVRVLGGGLQEDQDLLLGQVGIDQRQRHTVKRQVPCGKPPGYSHASGIRITSLTTRCCQSLLRLDQHQRGGGG